MVCLNKRLNEGYRAFKWYTCHARELRFAHAASKLPYLFLKFSFFDLVLPNGNRANRLLIAQGFHFIEDAFVLCASLRAKKCDTVEFRLILCDVGSCGAGHRASPNRSAKNYDVVKRWISLHWLQHSKLFRLCFPSRSHKTYRPRPFSGINELFTIAV